MVGTILRVGPSAMIWFGWGNVAPGETVGIKGTGMFRAIDATTLSTLLDSRHPLTNSSQPRDEQWDL